jgi:hypothetical protein
MPVFGLFVVSLIKKIHIMLLYMYVFMHYFTLFAIETRFFNLLTIYLMGKYFLAFSLFLAGFGVVSAQEQKKEPSYTFNLSLNQDAFFGFYPTVNATVSLSDKTDLSFYSIIWTTPSFGTGGGGGLWTEFGTGLNLKAANGALVISPAIGFLNGKLLSNGNYSMPFEGIVPAITANLSTALLEGQFYLGYYAATRKGKIKTGSVYTDAPIQNNFLHYWINGGIKTGGPLSLGLHFEQLRSNPSSGASADVYKWFGPYVQFMTGKGHGIRFTTGGDITKRVPETEQNGFYKLTTFLNF